MVILVNFSYCSGSLSWGFYRDYIFAVFVGSLSLMDNHLHLLLRIDPEVASNIQIAEAIEAE